MPMNTPLRIDVTRGGIVESTHAVRAVVVDGAGAVVMAFGDVEAPTFPRSAIKILQAIPLITTGAADAVGYTDAELALACASHSGEEAHRAMAAAMLEKVGLDEDALECGCHWPFDAAVGRQMAARGEQPTPLGNNCSGKHAGFLCTAAHLGEPLRGYVEASHPVQRRAEAAIVDLAGAAGKVAACGTDGCSIPTYAAPLRAFAHAFARLAAGRGAGADRLAAGRRLMEACMAHPFEMSGTDRACLRLMAAAPGRVFAKTGAEGVYCGAIPELGLGLALKAEDGATRAAESAVAAILTMVLADHDADLAERYRGLARTRITSWTGRPAGEIAPAGRPSLV